MEDLELQLLNLMQDNWKLENKEQTVFNRNRRRIDTAAVEPHVIFREVADVNDWTNEDMADCRAVVSIETRISVEAVNTDKIEEVKEEKHEVREEIYRILKAMNRGEIAKPDGWEWAYVTRRLNLDNFDAPTPLLGEEFQVTIAYERV